MREEILIDVLFTLGIMFAVISITLATYVLTLRTTMSVKKAKRMITSFEVFENKRTIIPQIEELPSIEKPSVAAKPKRQLLTVTIPSEAQTLLEKLSAPIHTSNGWLYCGSVSNPRCDMQPKEC